VPSRRAAGLAALAVLIAAAPAAAEPFAGTVLDGATLAPVRGALVTAADGTTARSDRLGAFRFADLPPGPIEMVVTAPGYEPSVEEVEIAEGSGSLDHIFILFRPGAAAEVIEIEDVAPVPPSPGRQDLGRTEIQRIPGTRGDALTAVRSLPGVGSQPAFGAGPGQVVIRGSAPEDSKITIDGIEIPVLYHFFGVQSVLPTELIENIEFQPGGFGAEEGRSTGGVINVVTRSEAVGEAEGFAELSFINVAGFVQAPLPWAKDLQLTAGLRRSTVDLILPAVLPDSANLAFTTAPQYYDGQARIDWRRREGERVSVLVLGSYDLLSLLNDNLNPNEPELTNRFDNEVSFARMIGSWQRARRGLDHRLTVAAGPTGFRVEIGSERYLRFRQWVAEIRDDVSWTANPRLRLRGGAEARWDRRSLASRFPAPPVEGMPPPGNFSNAPLVDYERVVHSNLAGAYLAADLRPIKRLLITPGLRLDYFAFIGEAALSPRLQVTHELADRWSVRAALGAYSRQPEGPESVDPDLVPERAFHYVLGGRWDRGDGVVAEASLFYNDKRRLVTRDAREAQMDPLTAYVNRGWGRAYGAEALVRARLADFFGWIAYTLQRSDRVDGPTPEQRLFDWDQTHNLVLVGSYRLGRWQLGGRFQYATGRPITPIVGARYLTDLNAFIPVFGEINSVRMEAMHQLDLRVDRAWKFRTWELAAYLDVTNVYAHARVLGYTYSYDYTEREAITDLPIVPAIGVRGSF
jgi:outer membrane receptor protein involved in Fe transport